MEGTRKLQRDTNYNRSRSTYEKAGKVKHTYSLRNDIVQIAQESRSTFFDGSYFEEPLRDDFVPKTVRFISPSWSHTFFVLLVLADSFITVLATLLVFFLHPETYIAFVSQRTHEHSLVLSLFLIVFAWVISLYVARAYERHTMGEGYELYSKIIRAGLTDFIFLCALGFVFRVDVPRFLAVFVPLLSTALTLVERWLFRRLLHYYRTIGRCNYSTVVVGSPEGIHKALLSIQHHSGLGYNPVAICPIQPIASGSVGQDEHVLHAAHFEPKTAREMGLQILTMNSHLPQKMKHLNIETVLITDAIDRHSETMRTFSLAVESMGIELAFTSAFAYSTGSNLRLRDNQAIPIVTAYLPQYNLPTLIFKRIFDIILSILSLVFFSPLMLLVACAIKIEDGGPVLFKQQRIGLYGRPFIMYKFRSMHIDADKQDKSLAAQIGADHGILFKVKDDPRITQVGKFIRKTSLDEFPQFFNSLKGDMSIVGPRPQQDFEISQYNTLYSSRLLIRPGITGLWQISGRSDLSREESEQLDVSYVEQWSLSGDIAILLKTVVAVIKRKGSY